MEASGRARHFETTLNVVSSKLTEKRKKGLASSALSLALLLEVGNHLRELVVLCIEVCQREFKHFCQPLLSLKVRMMSTCFVAIDAGARDEFVQASLDSQDALRDAKGLSRLPQSATVDMELSALRQSCIRPEFPCTGASGRCLDFDTTFNVVLGVKLRLT